ncbi:MAG: bifunctional 5,10-methylenetetrahydrofolate dehydrogenase/5,10-methenyltetrahydrofolate cyclohydrolase [Planctomycetota bacterium]
MTAQIIDGDGVANAVKATLEKEIQAIKDADAPLQLVAVQVGENAASRVYVKNQKESCEAMGISYRLDELGGDTTQEAVLAHIEKLNGDGEVTGIILQMPLPPQCNAREVQAAIAPEKDVEGMNPANLGRVILGEPWLAPCTAMGAFKLIQSTGIEFYRKNDRGGPAPGSGKRVVVVGHSEIVGKPLSLLLVHQFCTVTTCHIATKDLGSHTREAEILAVACGVPGLIKKDMVRPGAMVIDIGINRVSVLDDKGQPVLDQKGKPKKKTVGDVDFDAVKEVAGWITPVPGGVGPMTVAMLLANTVTAAKALR